MTHVQTIAALRAALDKTGLDRTGLDKTGLDRPALDRPASERAGLAANAAQRRAPLGHALADACLKGGLLRGALHEVFAAPGHEAAAAGFAAGLAARAAAGRHVLWIRQDFSAQEFGEVSAMGLLELGLDPQRLLMLRVADAADGLRGAADALACAALGAVVLEIPGRPKLLDLVTSRRLTLAAAQKSVTAFLLRFAAEPGASTAETRWLIRAATSPPGQDLWGYPVVHADLLRNRNGQLGQWVMGWNCDDGVFQHPAAHPVALVPPAGDGPAAPA